MEGAFLEQRIEILWTEQKTVRRLDYAKDAQIAILKKS
jgi:hypothetical protein